MLGIQGDGENQTGRPWGGYTLLPVADNTLLVGASWAGMNVHLNKTGCWWCSVGSPGFNLQQPGPQSSGMVVLCLCNPSTQEVEAGGLGVQGHPCLYNKSEAGLGLTRLCLNKHTEKRPAAG